ncbi:type I-PGING CRISPR-associated protein Cas5p [Spirosoma sp. 48-14]|uniref:type I-PGING CRISPR-associated protein Cas5p n=1 Tax=Spirosoma sp. 48-14 TaxID=1895854 RepID=UPI00095E1A64|nr:type I-PGING CRISPR-associated protein Cas5p [Spirosoma sp. 48-14]OJW70704.1 MAG: type I-PGING CRISPR-associated protein Cas5p [Spirosoma sp. 48-14]
MDISFITQDGERTNCKLILQPLAPYSMIDEVPGSYYKTLTAPSKHQLCGLFENVLGLHLSLKDRERLFKDLTKAYEKKQKGKVKFEKAYSKSGYLPLLYHLFDISLTLVPPVIHIDDLWKKAFRRTDAGDNPVHANGSMNQDIEVVRRKRLIERDSEKPDRPTKKALGDLFTAQIGSFPLYYSTLATREYLMASGSYVLKLDIDAALLQRLEEALITNNLVYLGTNDGWVDIQIDRS